MLGHFLHSLSRNNYLVLFLFLWTGTVLNYEKIFQMVCLEWYENKVVSMGTQKLIRKEIKAVHKYCKPQI